MAEQSGQDKKLSYGQVHRIWDIIHKENVQTYDDLLHILKIHDFIERPRPIEKPHPIKHKWNFNPEDVWNDMIAKIQAYTNPDLPPIKKFITIRNARYNYTELNEAIYKITTKINEIIDYITKEKK